jgi:hypothetical protein
MKLKHCIHLLPLLCGFLALIAHTPARPQGPLVLENFNERLSKDVPVSGRVLVGAVAVLPGETAKPPALPAHTLLWRAANKESVREPLCVTLASRDGQYFGEGTLSADKLRVLTGPQPITWEHHRSSKEHLLKLHQNDVAVLATTGDCRLGTTDGKTTIHVLHRRDAGAPAPQGGAPSQFTLQLMLNSMTYALAVEASIDKAGSRQVTCTELPDAQRNRAFNTLCELLVPTAATGAVLTIKRRRYERTFEPIKFNLAWSPLS